MSAEHESNAVKVRLLDRDYLLSCAPAEREQLLACARYVEQRMVSIRDGGKVLGADRIAVMAALQMAQELFAARNAEGIPVGDLRKRLRDLHVLADDMLGPQERLF